MKAVIFDFDGVIVNSEDNHYRASCEAYRSCGIHLDYEDYVNRCLGHCDKESFKNVLSQYQLFYSDEELQALIDVKRKAYLDLIKDDKNLKFVPNVEKYLLKVIQENKRIAICSGSSAHEVHEALERLQQGYFKDYFTQIITADDFQRGKPDPESYLLTCSMLGLPAEQCCVIEDSPSGVQAAKDAGAYVIGILTNYKKNQLQLADKLIKNFSELL